MFIASQHCVRSAADKNQPHRSDLRRVEEISQEARIHFSKISADHLFRAHLRPGPHQRHLDARLTS